jgi:hypothetical protein
MQGSETIELQAEKDAKDEAERFRAQTGLAVKESDGGQVRRSVFS